jgi:hypothetical protein
MYILLWYLCLLPAWSLFIVMLEIYVVLGHLYILYHYDICDLFCPYDDIGHLCPSDNYQTHANFHQGHWWLFITMSGIFGIDHICYTDNHWTPIATLIHLLIFTLITMTDIYSIIYHACSSAHILSLLCLWSILSIWWYWSYMLHWQPLNTCCHTYTPADFHPHYNDRYI